MRKSFFKLAVFAFVFVFPISAPISFADEKKIAVVDLQKIEQEALISKDLQKQMMSKEAEIGKNLTKRKSKIEQEFKTLESKRAVLSGEELQKRAKKLEGDFQKLQIDEKIYLQAFDLARVEALKNMQDNVKKAVNKVAGKYDLIIPSNLALYVNTNSFDDLTSDVIKKLDGISKSVEFEKIFKEAKARVDEMVEEQRKQAKKK